MITEINGEKWFIEKSFHQNYMSGHKIKHVLYEGQSEYQNIKVAETHSVGKLLLLDDKTMVSDIDEFVYHEVTSHLPYMVHPNVQNVLVIGGGDGGVVREFTKHADIKSIDLVEIDQQVVSISKEFFPNCTSGLSDPRVTVHYKDGIEFIKNAKDCYDIIVIDSTDPVDFASGLFTKEFYAHVNTALRTDGIMINQTENPFYDEYGISDIYQNLRAAFPIVASLTAPMMIYPGSYWTFGFSSKKYKATELVPAKVARMKSLQENLKWYNMDWHQGVFKVGNLHKRKTNV